jgi:hypothetical protein
MIIPDPAEDAPVVGAAAFAAHTASAICAAAVPQQRRVLHGPTARETRPPGKEDRHGRVARAGAAH